MSEPSAWDVAVAVKEELQRRGHKAMATSSEIGSIVAALDAKGQTHTRTIAAPDGFTTVKDIADSIEQELFLITKP